MPESGACVRFEAERIKRYEMAFLGGTEELDTGQEIVGLDILLGVLET